MKLKTLVLTLLIFPSFLDLLIGQEDPISRLETLYYDEKDYTEVVNYASSVEITDQSSDYTKLAVTYFSSLAHYRLNDFLSANIEINDIYLEIDQLNPKDSSEARLIIDVCQRVSDFSFMTEEYKKGIDALSHGLAISDEYLANDYWRRIKMLHKSGAINRIQGSLKESKKNLDLALEIVDSLPAPKKNYILPTIQSELAGWYNYNHQPKKAIEIYQEIIKVAEQDSNYRRLDIYNNNIANSYSRLSDYGKALHYMQESLKAKNKAYTESHPKVISLYNNLAGIYTELGDNENAQVYYEKASSLIRELLPDEKDIRLSILEVTKAKAEIRRKNYKKALVHLDQLVGNIENGIVLSEDEKYSIYQLKGFSHSQLSQYDDAKIYLEKSIRGRKEMQLDKDFELATSYLYLFDIYKNENNTKKSQHYLNKAFETIELTIEDGDFIEKSAIPQSLLIFFQYKIIDIADGLTTDRTTLKDGETHIEKALSLIKSLRYARGDHDSKSNLLDEVQNVKEAILSFYITAYDKTKNEKYIEQVFEIDESTNNNFLYQSLAEESSEKYGIPQNVIEEKNQLKSKYNKQKEELNELESDTKKDFDVYANLIAEVNKTKTDLYNMIEDIRIKYPSYYNLFYSYPTTSIANLQKSLSNDEITAQYFQSRKNVYCLVISNTDAHLKKLGATIDIQDKANELISCVSAIGDCKNLQSDMYQELIDPINLKKDQKLYVVAEQLFGNLPFEILLNKNGEYLLERNTISYQFSSTLKAAPFSDSGCGHRNIAMAPFYSKMDISETDELQLRDESNSMTNSLLPYSKKEVEAISALFEFEPVLGGDATLDAFLSNASDANIIHFATHGVVNNKNPNLSRLLFASNTEDNKIEALYANEIVNLDLKPDLLTLSACNTGTGKKLAGEGVSSIGKAFVFAGCPNQVISLWSVNDASTAELMENFYTSLKTDISKTEALRQAKLNYLENAPELFKHPYYWSGFIYYGDNRPLKKKSFSYTKTLLFSSLVVLLFGFLWKRNRKSSSAA